MSEGRIGGLFKLLIAAGGLYVAYKFGEKKGEKNAINAVNSAKEDLECEIEFYEGLIKDYEDKRYKSLQELEYMELLKHKLKKLKVQI